MLGRLALHCPAKDESSGVALSLGPISRHGDYAVSVCSPSRDAPTPGDSARVLVATSAGALRLSGKSVSVLEPLRDLLGDSRPELVLKVVSGEGYGSVVVVHQGEKGPVADSLEVEGSPPLNTGWAQWGPPVAGSEKSTLYTTAQTQSVVPGATQLLLFRLVSKGESFVRAPLSELVFPGVPSGESDKTLANALKKLRPGARLSLTHGAEYSWAEIGRSDSDSSPPPDCDSSDDRDSLVVSSRSSTVELFGTWIASDSDFDADGTADWVVWEDRFCVMHVGMDPNAGAMGGMRQFEQKSLSLVLSSRGAPKAIEVKNADSLISPKVGVYKGKPAILALAPGTRGNPVDVRFVLENGKLVKK